MIIPRLLTLVAVAFVVVHADSNLRGRDIIDRAANFAGNQQFELSGQDELINSVIDQIINNDPANGSPEAQKLARSNLGGNIADLLNYDGGNPELSYQGFLVSKVHSHEDCSGPVTKLGAVNLGCIKSGQDSSGMITCDDVGGMGGGEDGGNGGIVKRKLARHHAQTPPPASYTVVFYKGTKCQGEPTTQMQLQLPPCNGGVSSQCISRKDTPTFLKHDSLVTYKFADAATCSRFAKAHLGYGPEYKVAPDTDDALSGLHQPTDDGDEGGEGDGGDASDDEERKRKEKEDEQRKIEEEERQRQEEEEQRQRDEEERQRQEDEQRQQEEQQRQEEEQRQRDEEERQRQEEEQRQQEEQQRQEEEQRQREEEERQRQEQEEADEMERQRLEQEAEQQRIAEEERLHQEELDRLAEEARLQQEEEERRRREEEGQNTTSHNATSRRMLSVFYRLYDAAATFMAVPPLVTKGAHAVVAVPARALAVVPVRATATTPAAATDVRTAANVFPNALASNAKVSVSAAIIAAATVTQESSSTGKHTESTDKEALVAVSEGGDREFALLQIPNGLCTYDEKYGLYVKTACQGVAGRMLYHIFIDKQCTRMIKIIAHDLVKTVPNYGICVGSDKYREAKLTVCHNSGHLTVPKD